MPVVLQIAALTAVLFVAQEVLRRAGRWVVWSLFLAAPVVLLPYWVRVNDYGPFLWVKIASVCVAVGWGAALRFTPLGDCPRARRGVPLILAVNVLEAVALDVYESGTAHRLNAAAGALLVATLPYGRRATRVASAGPCRDLVYGTTRGWVCAYVAWNWTFVLLNFPALAGHHTAVLAAGLVVAALDPRRWGQTRACTLGLNLIATATFHDALVSWLDTSHWGGPVAGVVAAGGSLAFVTGAAAWAVVFRRRRPGAPLPLAGRTREGRLAPAGGARHRVRPGSGRPRRRGRVAAAAVPPAAPPRRTRGPQGVVRAARPRPV